MESQIGIVGTGPGVGVKAGGVYGSGSVAYGHWVAGEADGAVSVPAPGDIKKFSTMATKPTDNKATAMAIAA